MFPQPPTRSKLVWKPALRPRTKNSRVRPESGGDDRKGKPAMDIAGVTNAWVVFLRACGCYCPGVIPAEWATTRNIQQPTVSTDYPGQASQNEG